MMRLAKGNVESFSAIKKLMEALFRNFSIATVSLSLCSPLETPYNYISRVFVRLWLSRPNNPWKSFLAAEKGALTQPKTCSGHPGSTDHRSLTAGASGVGWLKTSLHRQTKSAMTGHGNWPLLVATCLAVEDSAPAGSDGELEQTPTIEASSSLETYCTGSDDRIWKTRVYCNRRCIETWRLIAKFRRREKKFSESRTVQRSSFGNHCLARTAFGHVIDNYNYYST